MRFVACLVLIAAPHMRAAIDFDREIRPILSDNCLACHGPDAKSRKANLHLDVADGGAFANGIITPGNAAASRLVQRISEPVAARRMPPPYSGRTRTPQQIEKIKQWIDQGAKWQTQRAFEAPSRTSPT